MQKTVKQEIAELRQLLSDLEWNGEETIETEGGFHRTALAIQSHIDYLNREYVSRGMIYEPNF